MKKFLSTVLIILIVTCVSCADSINEIEKTFNEALRGLNPPNPLTNYPKSQLMCVMTLLMGRKESEETEN